MDLGAPRVNLVKVISRSQRYSKLSLLIQFRNDCQSNNLSPQSDNGCGRTNYVREKLRPRLSDRLHIGGKYFLSSVFGAFCVLSRFT